MKIATLAVGATLALAACGSSGGTGSTGSNNASSPAGTSSVAPGGGSSSPTTKPGSDVKVGMAYDIGGRGDKSFNDLAAAGLDKAKSQLGVQVKELSASKGESEQAKEARLQLLASSGYNPIVAVGFAYATAVMKIVPKYPKVHFAIIDDGGNCTSTKDGGTGVQPNVACLLFTEEQSSYLVGVAAALATKKKDVGFVGGVNTPLIQKFQAGFQAGVHVIDKSIKIQVKYLTQPPDFGGFNDSGKGKTAALGMYNSGADIVYQAAGASGLGVFDAAKTTGNLAIGVDSDQYNAVPSNEKSLILTSALKGVDTATFDFIQAATTGQFKAGIQRFSLKDNGVGYSTSNPAIKPYEAKIDMYKQEIIDGKITVPTTI